MISEILFVKLGTKMHYYFLVIAVWSVSSSTSHTGKMYTSIWWYLRVLPVLHRPEVVDIGVNTI